MRRRVFLGAVLTLLCVPAWAEDKDKDKEKTVAVAGIKPGQARNSIDALLGPPVLSDPINRIYHYAKSVIVTCDPSDRVLTVHGLQLDVDDKKTDITTLKELEDSLGKADGKPADTSQKGYTSVRYGHHGLTVFFHGDEISGFLLEPPRR